MNRLPGNTGDDDDILYDLEINYSTDDLIDSAFEPAEYQEDDYELGEWSNEDYQEKGEPEFDD